MKPRIKLKRRFTFKGMWYECQGVHPQAQAVCFGYGRTPQAAYERWYEDQIPF